MSRAALPPEMMAQRLHARRVFARALKNGVVIAKLKCERCGCKQIPGVPRNTLGGIEAHHPDYAWPLHVEWLCHWCHRSADEQKRARDAFYKCYQPGGWHYERALRRAAQQHQQQEGA